MSARKTYRNGGTERLLVNISAFHQHLGTASHAFLNGDRYKYAGLLPHISILHNLLVAYHSNVAFRLRYATIFWGKYYQLG